MRPSKRIREIFAEMYPDAIGMGFRDPFQERALSAILRYLDDLAWEREPRNVARYMNRPAEGTTGDLFISREQWDKE